MAGGDSNVDSIIKIGPGGRPTNADTNWDLKGISKISSIFISYGEDDISNRITSLQFQYIENFKKKLTPVYGGNHAGRNFDTVRWGNDNYGLNEFVIGLSGATLQHGNYERVTCLTIETNRKKYGPFGSIPAGAKSFSFRFGNSHPFYGFFGSYSSHYGCLTSIGVYVHPNLY